MAQTEKKQANFIIMRLYDRQDGNLYMEGRAVVKVCAGYAPGTPVRFKADGRDYFGDVVECFSATPGSELCRVLEALSGRNVYVHFPEDALKK